MIEKCEYCQEEHETDEATIGGSSFKSCPQIPTDNLYHALSIKSYLRAKCYEDHVVKFKDKWDRVEYRLDRFNNRFERSALKNITLKDGQLEATRTTKRDIPDPKLVTQCSQLKEYAWSIGWSELADTIDNELVLPTISVEVDVPVLIENPVFIQRRFNKAKYKEMVDDLKN